MVEPAQDCAQKLLRIAAEWEQEFLGAELLDMLAVTRAAVWRHAVNELRDAARGGEATDRQVLLAAASILESRQSLGARVLARALRLAIYS